MSLIGFLGQDAQTKTTANGEPSTVLRLDIQESGKDSESGEWVRRTEWHRIVCWGKLATWAADLKCGAQMAFESSPRFYGVPAKQEETTGARLETAENGTEPPKVSRRWEARADSFLKLDRSSRPDASNANEFAFEAQ